MLLEEPKEKDLWEWLNIGDSKDQIKVMEPNKNKDILVVSEIIKIQEGSGKEKNYLEDMDLKIEKLRGFKFTKQTFRVLSFF